MTLSSWQRVGVVLSIAWLLGAPVFAWDVYTDNGQQRVEIALLKCELEGVAGSGGAPPSTHCAQKVRDAYARAYQMMWVKIIFIAIVPVALGWMGVLISRKSLRRNANAANGTD